MSYGGQQSLSRNVESYAQHSGPIGYSHPQGNLGEQLLGPPVGGVRPNPYDKVPQTNVDMPEYYKDQAMFMRETIEGFITFENIEWYTTVCLPWMKTDQIHFEWDMWHFNTPLAGRVPHEGISRMIQSRTTKKRAHSVRRGIAFQMERDYYGTPAGDVQWARNVLGIAQSVQETQNHDTIYALLSSKDYYKMWEDKYGKGQVSFKKILENEIERFGTLIYDQFDLDVIVEDEMRSMNKIGVSPNLLILPPKSKIFLAMAQKEKTQYLYAGPDGIMRQKQGPDAIQNFRGLNVFETRDFLVYSGSPPVDLTSRAVQIGEVYLMNFTRYESSSPVDYQSKWRDTYIYDRNVDDFRKISFKTALIRSRIFDTEGYSKDLRKLGSNYTKHNRVRTLKHTEEYNSSDDPHLFNPRETGTKTEPPIHFLYTPKNDGTYMLANYFGQLALPSCDHANFEFLAKTIISKKWGDNWSSAINSFNKMMTLIREIENQPYDHRFFMALIQENSKRNWNEAGDRFIGQKTPQELMDTWGYDHPLTEWKPNSYGSLDLPEGKFDSVFPPGFANFPGLKTLSSKSFDSKSVWNNIAKDCKKAIELCTILVNMCERYLPFSDAIDANNRPPWFHLSEKGTTLFATLISVNRDPIFLGLLSPITGKGGTATMDTDDDGTIKWFEGVHHFLNDLSADGLQEAINRREGVGYDSPITGESTVVPPELISPAFNSEVKAMMMLGSKSVKLYNALVQFLQKNNQLDEIKDLNEIIYRLGVGSKEHIVAKQFVTALHQKAGVIGKNNLDAQVLAENIAKYKVPDSDESKIVNKWKREIKQLVSQASSETNDPNIFTTDLVKAWESEITKARTGGNDISYTSLSDTLFDVMDMLKKIQVIEKDFTFARLMTDTALTEEKFDLLRNKANRLVLELKSKASKLGIDLSNVFQEEFEGRRTSKETLAVKDSTLDTLGTQYLRAPLTMSLTLLESIAAHGVSAVIRPSDPRTGHTTHFSSSTDEPLPDHIWQRPQYADIATILTDSDARSLDDTPFISKLMNQNYDYNSNFETIERGQKRKTHIKFKLSDDEEDDIDEDDEIESLLSGGSKRTKIGHDYS